MSKVTGLMSQNKILYRYIIIIFFSQRGEFIRGSLGSVINGATPFILISKLGYLKVLITNLILESLAPSRLSRAGQPCQLYSLPGNLKTWHSMFEAFSDI